MAPTRCNQAGFTLVEILISAAILVVVAAIGVPHYVSALRVARISKAKQELVTISNAIGAHAAINAGRLPLSIHQVGFGGKLDPWGTPYCYLNYGDGTGDGLQWAIDAGIVDPTAFDSTGSSGGGGGGGGLLGPLLPGGGGGGMIGPLLPGGGGLLGPRLTGGVGLFGPLETSRLFVTAWLAAVASIPQGTLGGVLDAEEARAAATDLATKLTRTITAAELEGLVSTLISGGNFDIYTSVPTETTRRRDRYMYPLNTDFDLFSLGPDGRTAVSLGEKVAQDDVIRANNGGYYGTASSY